ncbi:SIMPL domain-containing protein [Qipengyuania sp. MTN3-11]|uniref:SIMPL domain-containing protein n=1 Tax=Qipengyuania sp. MTN3-11 TaxID=3056557 RepID=UPI0036F3E329
MNRNVLALASVATFGLAACGDAPYDPRGVDHDETLLSVSATGEAETRPDEAFFEVGVNNWSTSASSASEANTEDIEDVVAALGAAGIPEEDIQTRTVGIQRIEYGDRKGQFQASNVVSVTVRDIDNAGRAVTAATEAGANVLSGPDLRISDSERAANAAYGEAFRAARARAEAYAEAADMEIARVLTIRDGGGSQGDRYIPGAPPPPVAPVVQTMAMPEEGGRIMPGQTTSRVAVSVDFALRPK